MTHKLAVSDTLIRAAYDRFLINALDTDKACRAELPIVAALTTSNMTIPICS